LVMNISCSPGKRYRVVDFRELKFGIEIETTGRTRGTVAKAIQSVVGGTVEHVGHPSAYDPHHVVDAKGRLWKVVADSSLSDAPSNLRAEIVSPVLTYQDIPELQEVVRAVRKCGSKATDTCGCHIHVDGSLFTGRTLANLVKIFYKQQELIIQALGVRPDRLAKYTKKIGPDLVKRIERKRPQNLDQMNQLWYGQYNPSPQHYDSHRYCVLNLSSMFYRGSIEMRAANSSLHAGVIRAYVVFVLALAAKALNNRCASGRPRQYDPESARYDFRVFACINLGLKGDEFKSVRHHLLGNLPGDAAFKHGRPKSKDKKTHIEAQGPAEVDNGEH